MAEAAAERYAIDDPNTIHRLPPELREQVRFAARTAAPIYQMFGWTHHDGHIPGEEELLRIVARAVESVLSGVSSGYRASRFVVERGQGEQGMDDEITISLHLATVEIEPIEWPAVKYAKLAAAAEAELATVRNAIAALCAVRG